MSNRIDTLCAERSLTAVAPTMRPWPTKQPVTAKLDGQGGMVPTSNRSFRDWEEIFDGNAALNRTLLDRLRRPTRGIQIRATAAASLLRSNSGGKRVLRLPRPETNRFRCEAPLCVRWAHALRRGSAAVETAVRLDGCIRWPSATWLRPQALTSSRRGLQRALD